MLALTRWNDTPALSLRDAFSQVFDNTFAPVLNNGPSSYQAGYNQPGTAANIWESGDEYQIAVMIPGVDPDKVNLTTVGNTLTIEGALELSAPEGAKSVWQEFGPTQFRRQISLPSGVDSEHIKAMYRNGILLLTVPKAEHAKSRSIKIQPA
jgi:HSP20 family protein